MPKALSNDLRKRIVDAYKAGEGSYNDLAARFHVGYATVNRILARHRKTGAVDPMPHGGGPPPYIPESKLPEFKDLVAKHPDSTYEQLAVLCSAHFKLPMTRSTVMRACRKAKLTRKKKP